MLALSSVLVFLTTFLAAGLAALIGWFALQRLGAEAVAEDVSDHLLDESPRLLKDDSYSTISPWARLLEKSDFVRIMHRHLLQAGLTWSVGRVTLLMLLASSVALGFAMQFDWIPGWVDLLITAAVVSLPYALYSEMPREALSQVRRKFSRCPGFTRSLAARRASFSRCHGHRLGGMRTARSR